MIEKKYPKGYQRQKILDEVMDLCSDNELRYLITSSATTLHFRKKGYEKQKIRDNMLKNINKMTDAKTQLEKDIIEVDQRFLASKL